MTENSKKSYIKFVTLFPQCSNLELMKDVGQIPYTLGKNYENMETKLVGCNIRLNDEKLKKMPEMEIERIPLFFNNVFLTGIYYILKNNKNVDWFNFYHGGRKVYYWTKLYKWLNPKGKVYLKLDLSYEGCQKYFGNRKEKRIFNKTIEAVDIVSVESAAIKTIVQKYSNVDIKLIANGYIEQGKLDIKKTSERDKTLITVGRLGTVPKATDLLLEGFAINADEHDWTLKLVGPIDENFKGFIDDFFKKYPDLRKRVIFTGSIYNKKQLYDLYNSSRVFVLPSRWEGFPLVGPEALHCGCRVILTDVIPPIKELTANGRYGITIKANVAEAIAEGIINEVQRDVKEDEPYEISEYAKEELSWDGICERLYYMLEK